jgi:hypothetical protein
MRKSAIVTAIILPLIAVTHCQKLTADEAPVFESKDISGVVNPNTVIGSTTWDPDSRTCTVVGGGADIWLQDDGFRYVYLKVPAEVGDFDLSCCIRMPVEWPDPLSKAGIMVRQDLDANSAHVTLCASRDNGIEMLHRYGKGALAQNTGTPDRLAPYGNGTLKFRTDELVWLKITRQGDTFTGSYSYNGTDWLRPPPWDQHSTYSIVLEGTYYVGFCLASHIAGTATTASFAVFKFPLLIGTRAIAGPDVWVYGNELATLDGTKSRKATSFQWAQVRVDSEPTVTINNPNQAIATFTPPGTQIGYPLTFRLTVTGEAGADTDEVQYFVRAINPPKVAPGNFRVHPIDQGDLLGFRLLWDPVFDAEKYQVATKSGAQYYFVPPYVPSTWRDFTGMMEGMELTVAVRGGNKFTDPESPDPSKHGVPSWDLTYEAMRNLALPASLGGGYPPTAYVYKVQPFASVNNLNLNENVSSYQAQWGKPEDYWGYLWDHPYYLERIVYYTAEFLYDGGWFTSLNVQVTQDGVTWTTVPIVRMDPAYDFTDSPSGRKAFTRYDFFIPTLRAKGIRICGRPGGWGQYSSIAEIEVYGNQTHVPEFMVVQGLDATYPEGSAAILDGSYSFSWRPMTHYKWEKVSGPDVTIQNADSPIATFTSPIVASDTVMVFKLTAGDGYETVSDSDIRITIENVPTIPVAGPDQPVLEGTQVTLDGSGSTTTTGTLSYLWTQTAGTDVGITGSTSAVVSFTAPVLWDFTEELKFRLDVDDGAGGKSSDEVVVTVHNFAGLVSPLGPGYFKDLLHMGETATDRVTAPLVIGTDHLKTFGGQASVNPRPGEPYDFTGTDVMVSTKPAVWAPLRAHNGWFMSSARPAEALDNFIQYYHLYVISPEDRDVQWHFRHDDEIRIWNNGVTAILKDDADEGVEIVRYGFAATGTGLKKGVNSLTVKFHDGIGVNHLAVGITDPDGNEFTDLQYSLGLPAGVADAYAARNLPDSYEPNAAVHVTLSFRVNPANVPATVSIREAIPPGIPSANINAPGATVGAGGIVWVLTGDQVKTNTITYSMMIPENPTQNIEFAGTVSFGTTTTDIIGENVLVLVSALPTEPRYLMVEMLMAAHLSWSPPAKGAVASYNVYRSVNGGPWEYIGSTAATSFVDSAVTTGNMYSYAVSAVDVNGIEGPRTPPSQRQTPFPGTMVVREAEDFNYDGGKFPWTSDATVPALEAPSATEIGTPQQYDYFYPGTGCPGHQYRPLDDLCFDEDLLDVGTTDQYHTNIASINVGSWFRYGFNVTQAGWIKLTFRVACPDGGMIAAYWDEELIGTASYDTDSWHTLTWVTMEQFEETDTGVHCLRVALLSGGYNFDKIAIGFNWTPPRRDTIWSDNFDTYSTDADVKAGGWTIENGSGYPDAAWRLWDTDGTMGQLGNQDPNIAGMYDKYMISDRNLAQEATLDERLVSKEVDCTNHIKVRLNFSKNYRAYSEDLEHLQVAEVDIQVLANGIWGQWVNLFHWDRNYGTSTMPVQVDIASLADKKKIRLRWHFYEAKWDDWFAIDQVRVSGEPST